MAEPHEGAAGVIGASRLYIPPAERARATHFFTYRMLFVEVCKCANVLKGLGIRKGDAVAIFTPNLWEAIVAVLACFRIGALFNTVFSGFSARSLRDRLESFQPKVILTADDAVRRGQRVALKATVDEAIKDLPCVQTVIVVRRTGRSWPPARSDPT